MEIVRKEISMDSLRNHVNGILPFINFNSEDPFINTVGPGNENGNYGGYVCDFVFRTVVWDFIFYKKVKIGGGKTPTISLMEIKEDNFLNKTKSKKRKVNKKQETNADKYEYVECVLPKGTKFVIYDEKPKVVTEDSPLYIGVKSTFKIKETGELGFSPRMAYLDALRRYEESKKIMENGIFVKKYNFSGDIESSHCISGKTHLEQIYWSNSTINDNSCNIEKERFSYKTEMADINEFKKDNNGNYITENDTYNNKDYLILVHNYDIIENNNKLWNEWWDFWWLRAYLEYTKHVPGSKYENGWEIYYLYDKYQKKYERESTTLNSEGEEVKIKEYCEVPFCYKFLWDFERYIIGKIYVPEKIDYGTKCAEIKGSKVPKFVYYNNYGKYITLIDAEKKYSQEWKNRGGQEFRDFLTGITPSWKTVPTLFDSGITFTYTPPKFELLFLFEDNTINEALYTPYEYSVNQGQLKEPRNISVTLIYDDLKIPQNISAALKQVGPEPLKQPEIYKMIIREDNIPIALCNNALESIENDEYIDKNGDTKDKLVTAFKEYNPSTTFTLKKKTTLYPHFSTTTLYQCDDCGYSTSEDIKYCPKCGGSKIIISHPKVETKISLLNSIEAINIDGNFYGCFATFDGNKGQMFKCEYSEDGWVYSTTSKEGLRCGDGEKVNSGDKVYRNATIVSCIEGMVENPSLNDVYYILARYKNTIDSPFTFPFKIGEKCNIFSIDSATTVYDMVISTGKTDDKLIVEYALGISSGDTIDISKNGIHYKEEFIYESGKSKILIDGQYEATLYYERASNEGLYTEIYNKELKLSRLVKLAQLTGMEIGTTWTKDNAISTLLFTKNGAEGLQDEPKYDIDVVFNRGSATAWESHFKLSECNTLEDLKNYSNGYFNV